MLSELKELIKVLSRNHHTLFIARKSLATDVNRLYCSRCGANRRVEIFVYSWNAGMNGSLGHGNDYEIIRTAPVVGEMICLECSACFIFAIYNVLNDLRLVLLPSVHGGLSTKHTPSGVSYYLDQAYNAEIMGANTSAVAMYRGSLEHILYEQGYVEGMLGQKIRNLENDIKAAKAPKWANELDPRFLKVIRDLGNGSIHPNDGDISKQRILDNDVLRNLSQTFKYLLFTIYEVEHEKNTLLESLEESALALKE